MLSNGATQYGQRGRSELTADIHRARNEQGKPSDDNRHDAGALPVPRDELEGLKQALVADYPTLLTRLTHALRSHELAAEALHDAYVRLGRGPAVGEVRNPLAYLYRMALNLASNVRRRELRNAPLSWRLASSLSDEAPGPERTVLAQIDVERTLGALQTLPLQRREIFLARWRDELSHDEIAVAFGLHKRTVQKELRRVELFLKAAADVA